jgi:hypothetical protein
MSASTIARRRRRSDSDHAGQRSMPAGTLVPGYTKEGRAQAGFFVHSPFGHRQDDQTVIDRNDASIVMQVTFRERGNDTYVLG